VLKSHLDNALLTTRVSTYKEFLVLQSGGLLQQAYFFNKKPIKLKWCLSRWVAVVLDSNKFMWILRCLPFPFPMSLRKP
jgi:hypothetical protein